MLMELSMKVIGRMIYKMATELKVGVMEVNMKEAIKKV
jgi:hypothetical protein